MRLKILFALLTVTVSLSAETKPNIVFVLADDLTRWDIGCYGSKDSRTPTLDRLASEGMRFTRCYQSAPMCSPTRHNLYTGIYPLRTGAYPNHTFVREGTKTIIHHLEPLGYRIALAGKRHIGPAEAFPFEYLDRHRLNLGAVDTFLLEVSESNEPFCLFLCSNEPHGPWNKGDASQFDRQKIILPPHYVDNEATRDAFCHYLAEINYLDWQVKQTLDMLDKHRLSGNTIFIFASEQGNAFPFAKWTCYDAGLGSALIVKWPGVVSPGITSDALVEYSDITPTMIDIAGGAPVDGLDGSSLVPVLKGEKTSHKKYTYGEMTTRGINKGSDYYPIRSVSNGTYRYVLNIVHDVEFSNVAAMPGWEETALTDPAAAELILKHKYRPAVELFNDREDPYNLHNLAGHKPYRKIQKKLAKKLYEWMEYCGDDGLLTELQSFEHMNRGNHDGLILLTRFHDAQPSGNLDVPVQGYYTFYINGEGSIHVDNQLIIEGSETAMEPWRPRYGIIALKEGMHRVDLAGLDEDAKIFWSGPSIKKTDLILNE